ncbi:MAG TPA: CPBP family intramembrane glutamic endopeptidase [Candidatus Dormibacteraeota bacterium]|nr:CPBP family intramembrane glutamic endopeptidase [Candidatus Dormibacteraeota bacterium]
MIQARLAAPRRAVRVTALVLGAALLRAVLLPFGDLLSTVVFGACLLAITLSEGNHYPLPDPPHKGEGNFGPLVIEGGKLPLAPGIVAGLMVGAVLLAPVVTGRLSQRPLADFWSWAAIAAVIATLEEMAIRGALYRRWSEEAGPAAAIIAGAAVFALIHLPRYGLAAMPLDAAVGLALGGLRAVTGRVLPCAIAHTIADWGAWFWA